MAKDTSQKRGDQRKGTSPAASVIGEPPTDTHTHTHKHSSVITVLQDEIVGIGRADEKNKFWFSVDDSDDNDEVFYYTRALICRRKTDNSRYGIEMPLHHLYKVCEYELQRGKIDHNSLVEDMQNQGNRSSWVNYMIVAHAAKVHPHVLFPDCSCPLW